MAALLPPRSLSPPRFLFSLLSRLLPCLRSYPPLAAPRLRVAASPGAPLPVAPLCRIAAVPLPRPVFSVPGDRASASRGVLLLLLVLWLRLRSFAFPRRSCLQFVFFRLRVAALSPAPRPPSPFITALLLASLAIRAHCPYLGLPPRWRFPPLPGGRALRRRPAPRRIPVSACLPLLDAEVSLLVRPRGPRVPAGAPVGPWAPSTPFFNGPYPPTVSLHFLPRSVPFLPPPFPCLPSPTPTSSPLFASSPCRLPVFSCAAVFYGDYSCLAFSCLATASGFPLSVNPLFRYRSARRIIC